MRLGITFLFVTAFLCVAGEAPAAGLGRSEVRARILARHDGRAPLPNDRAADLVDRFEVDNLAEMERRKLESAKVPVSPWSGYYWPIYGGVIANRYGDPNYNAALIWSHNEAYLSRMIGRGTTEELSPAEKYDLLVGDADFTLTRRMIAAGRPFANAKGEVETWFGICHGWAPASFFLPRPERAVKARASDGRELVFTPSDLKALGSLLWANAPFPTRFVGGRCEARGGSGRSEVNNDCLDNNPATWHLAVVNQIGIAGKSLILDAEKNYEVWNQPAYSYRYFYVNPRTKKTVPTLREAKAEIGSFRDSRARYRAKEARSVVEIVMSFDYLVENTPSLSLSDSAADDAHMVVTYAYDLELDENDRIVGGEWHSLDHPDFLWVPSSDARPLSEGDLLLDRRRDRNVWTGREPVPADWRDAAIAGSHREQPLARIVERLFQLSRGR